MQSSGLDAALRTMAWRTPSERMRKQQAPGVGPDGVGGGAGRPSGERRPSERAMRLRSGSGLMPGRINQLQSQVG